MNGTAEPAGWLWPPRRPPRASPAAPSSCGIRWLDFRTPLGVPDWAPSPSEVFSSGPGMKKHFEIPNEDRFEASGPRCCQVLARIDRLRIQHAQADLRRTLAPFAIDARLRPVAPMLRRIRFPERDPPPVGRREDRMTKQGIASATDRATFMARAPVDGLPTGHSTATIAHGRL